MNVDEKAFQEMLRNLRDQVHSAYSIPPDINFEEAKKRAGEAAKATEERMRKQAEQEAKARAEREEAFHRKSEAFWNWFDSREEDYTDAYKAHFTNPGQRQQQQKQSTGQRQQTQTKAPQTISEAFTLFGLSQRATSQEVKKKFWAMAKQGEYAHPDVGGDDGKFKILNAAYEIAFNHAKRNER
jgi:hypothetical protein